ncbi:5-formyltetrahydrofolate cyclo-ligase [Companilactobacillus pabuli]|uniref:5-formyltetrahydrofolate cyclo-ligase n=1 Tax=Companilactobacillus pabuli TaxID=2714036 RepID=A0A7L7KX47_9LACO|nr:5-formyltetrahydrofolate cyclo-ligase [Companilactobacillus pabuli]AKP03655.1 5-formyltetrahydrofolate cyclo-ligase [Companilactobacillus farciminis]AKS51960.1 5-formyltetrahydrofolate cyclo-ligase [Companilactobacillus farciminis]MDG5112864.1 5-formyltetrahydrofolate cyclo-ligase [Companilactobacillus pabuli]QMT84361.1 5-formyltetrahydrofolate cyclo-ligase [Companilactobacillus pabuli]GAQ00513.1 5-formyltetrahydrofolate cyclo-ligase [Companilactobacillus farciminis]
MDKVSFRKKQIDLVSDFMKSDKAQKEINNLYFQLFNDLDFQNAPSVGITMSTNDEIPTFPIINQCFEMGKEVYIPKTFSDYSMSFVKYTQDTELIESAFGVREPKDYENNVMNPPDLLIVPGLAYSQDKNRLGFGSGTFDRYLAKFPTKTISLALTSQYYSEPLWPVYVLDKQIDKIIVAKDEQNADNQSAL